MSKFDIDLDATIERFEAEIEFENEFRSLIASELDDMRSDALLPELDFH